MAQGEAGGEEALDLLARQAAGEFASVSSRADTEKAELAREAEGLSADPGFELDELGLSEVMPARPVQAALASAISFTCGGAGVARAVRRVAFWGAFAMAVTAWVGSLFGGPGG